MIPGRGPNRRGPAHAAGVDDPCRGIRPALLLLPDEAPQPVADALPGAVSRPAEVVAVAGAPVGVVLRQRPPLTTGGGDVEDRVEDSPDEGAAAPLAEEAADDRS